MTKLIPLFIILGLFTCYQKNLQAVSENTATKKNSISAFCDNDGYISPGRLEDDVVPVEASTLLEADL